MRLWKRQRYEDCTLFLIGENLTWWPTHIIYAVDIVIPEMVTCLNSAGQEQNGAETKHIIKQ